MSARGSIVFSMCFILSCGVSVHKFREPNITSKTKVEIPPSLISCALSDIVIISAPMIKNAQYYLTNPEGDAISLDITKPIYTELDSINSINNYENLPIKYNDNFKIITPLINYKVYNVNAKYTNETRLFEKYTRNVGPNDFVIGPLLEEDHGNWVLSAYKKENGDWLEMFQVITIEISEYIPPKQNTVRLHEGDTFEVSFVHPIAHVTSCELTAPRSTFDRFYERDHVNTERCGYAIKNVTGEDQGIWRITAVGKIVYHTQVYLDVSSCSVCRSTVLVE